MPSSVILRMKYDPESRALLIVFRGKQGAYRYFDVPLVEWVAFRGASSKGTYLNEVFKTKAYPCEKLAEDRLPIPSAGSGDSRTRDMKLEWGEIGQDSETGAEV